MLPTHANLQIIYDRALPSMKDASPPQLTLQGFQAALQTRFWLRSQPDPNIELVLVEVRAQGSAAEGAASGSFAILFHGPATPGLPQRTYRFEHDVLGTFDLFIVPVGSDKNGFHYEAVFNHQPARH